MKNKFSKASILSALVAAFSIAGAFLSCKLESASRDELKEELKEELLQELNPSDEES